MNAQASLDKILQDAKESASATLRDADDRAKEMEAAADKRIAAARAKTEAQARQDAEAATARMQRMAELDERKLLLADKHVAVVPGNAFEAEGFCRLSYAVAMESCMEGLRRIEEFVSELK